MKIKELKTIVDTFAKYNENAEINFNLMIENPYDENSEQDWYPLDLMIKDADEIDYQDYMFLPFEFKDNNMKIKVRKMFDKDEGVLD